MAEGKAKNTKKGVALINGRMLEWARKRVNVSVQKAAKVAAVDEDRYLRWEAGDEHPPMGKLRKLAEHLGFPTALFYMSEPPKDWTPAKLTDFRTLPGERKEDPELGHFRLWFEERQEILADIFEELEEEPPAFPITATFDSNPTDVGADLRRVLSLDELPSDAEGQYRTVRRRAERNLGVFAFQAQGVSTASMRGLSLGGDGKPQLLAVNGGDPPRARIFTLLHEMAHLATRSAGICDVDSATRKPKERFCNLVAACALMPEADVRAAWRLLATRSEEEIAEEVGRRFAVTKLAFLVRVVDLGVAPRSVLPQRAGMSAPLGTPNDAKPDRPVSFYRVRLARYGHRFMQTILRARAQGALSDLDATRAIDRSVSLKQLQGYRDELSKQGAAEL